MAGKLGRALVLLVLLAAALITQAPLAVFLLAFALVLLVLLRLDAAYLRRQVTAELLVPDKPVIQGEDFTLTVRLSNRSRLPIPALVVLLNAADEWGGGQITLRCAAMLGSKESAEQRITLNAGKSGVWSIAVRGITLRDHLGVFTAACPAAVQSRSICVLPAAAAGKAKAETAPDEDGDEADTRAALGGSYELREYRDGDTIKQVHWKLSAKLDRLMVREPLTALRAALTPGGDLDGAEEWGDFPQQAAKHRKNPPKRKKERTALSRRGAADPGSGLKFVDRVLVSTQRPAAHPALWLAADAALLLALTFGLLLVLSTGFGIAVPLWVWPAADPFSGSAPGVARGSRFLRRVGAVPACAASPAPLGAAGGGDCVSCGVVHLPAELFGRGAAVRREHCPKPERPPWQRAAGGPGRQCGAAGAVFAAGRPARYRGAGRCGPAPCGCPAAGSNAAARCCAAGAGRGRAGCACLPAAVGRLDGGVGGFLLGAAAGLVGQARYRKLPSEPLPPL